MDKAGWGHQAKSSSRVFPDVELPHSGVLGETGSHLPNGGHLVVLRQGQVRHIDGGEGSFPEEREALGFGETKATNVGLGL